MAIASPPRAGIFPAVASGTAVALMGGLLIEVGMTGLSGGDSSVADPCRAGGLLPKLAAMIRIMPHQVFGAATIAMFGLVARWECGSRRVRGWKEPDCFPTSAAVGMGLSLSRKYLPALQEHSKLHVAWLSLRPRGARFS